MPESQPQQPYSEAKSATRTSSKKPERMVRELERMVLRSEKYEITRHVAETYFTDASVFCTRLMIYFYEQVQQIRRKEQESK